MTLLKDGYAVVDTVIGMIVFQAYSHQECWAWVDMNQSLNGSFRFIKFERI
jgi:hypothetical protein